MGATAFTRNPAEGFWEDPGGRVARDDVIIVEVLVREGDDAWWRDYKRTLETRFKQETILNPRDSLSPDLSQGRNGKMENGKWQKEPDSQRHAEVLAFYHLPFCLFLSLHRLRRALRADTRGRERLVPFDGLLEAPLRTSTIGWYPRIDFGLVDLRLRVADVALPHVLVVGLDGGADESLHRAEQLVQ